MSAAFSRWLQQRLIAHGFPLAMDGIVGPITRSRLRSFQAAQGLRPTGMATPETVAALRLDRQGHPMPPARVPVRPPWLVEAERRMGLHERRHYSRLAAWLRSDGKALGDPRQLPWCGDFVATAIALTLPDEPQPANPYLARNWLRFGEASQGREGAVAVFWRGSRTGISGHVAFYVGEDSATYHVLGGNQSNAVTETRIAKDRLLGFRWPRTFQLDTKAVAKAANGDISTNEA